MLQDEDRALFGLEAGESALDLVSVGDGIDIGGGAHQERCDFPTFETCRAWISGQSRSFCVQNNWRGEYWGANTNRSEHQFNRVYR